MKKDARLVIRSIDFPFVVVAKRFVEDYRITHSCSAVFEWKFLATFKALSLKKIDLDCKFIY